MTHRAYLFKNFSLLQLAYIKNLILKFSVDQGQIKHRNPRLLHRGHYRKNT